MRVSPELTSSTIESLSAGSSCVYMVNEVVVPIVVGFTIFWRISVKDVPIRELNVAADDVRDWQAGEHVVDPVTELLNTVGRFIVSNESELMGFDSETVKV